MRAFLVNLPLNELSETMDELYRSGRQLNNVQNTQKFRHRGWSTETIALCEGSLCY